MGKRELFEKCLMLNVDDRKELESLLHQSLQPRAAKREDIDTRIKFLCETILWVANVKADIITEKKTRTDFTFRMMIAKQLMDEGYTTIEVGRQLKRSHCTITYYKKLMQDIEENPQFYPREYVIWQEFQNTLAKYENL